MRNPYLRAIASCQSRINCTASEGHVCVSKLEVGLLIPYSKLSCIGDMMFWTLHKAPTRPGICTSWRINSASWNSLNRHHLWHFVVDRWHSSLYYSPHATAPTTQICSFPLQSTHKRLSCCIFRQRVPSTRDLNTKKPTFRRCGGMCRG